MSTSRGCYARCSFCSVPRFFGLHNGKGKEGAWIARDADSVVAEVKTLYEQFGLLELLFVDDEFFGGGEAGFARACDIGRQLARLGLPTRFALSCRAENAKPYVLAHLQEGGLKHVFIGAESGSSIDLRLYGKQQEVETIVNAISAVRSLGISVQAGFMLFNHRSTLATVRESIEFLKAIGQFTMMTINTELAPHYGAPLATDMERVTGARRTPASLEIHYPDRTVFLARMAAEVLGDVFEPFMRAIAVLQATITYEWRRKVPWRRPPEQAVIDSFESAINRGFGDLFSAFLNELNQSTALPSMDQWLDLLHSETGRLKEGLLTKQAFTLLHLERAEGGIHQYTQRDAMRSNDMVRLT
jgi:hypothetical protein